MTNQIANADSNAPVGAPAATELTFNLTATNGSSLPGAHYFNVFPPALKTPSLKSQTLTALVSQPTTSENPTTTLTWKGGGGALALFALASGMVIGNVERTPVALGDTVAVAWVDGAFTITLAAGGPANAVEVTFAPGIPPDAQIGLVVGPAPILVSVPAGLSSLTLEPDLSPVAMVVFGTAFQLPQPEMSDASQARTIMFNLDTAVATASAQIAVGLENRIVQIA